MSFALFERMVLPQLKAEFAEDLLGVLLTGSRVHGQPMPNSDLDMHVLIDQLRRQRRNLVVDGLEIEMFLNPPEQIRRSFAERINDAHMFAFGQAAYDPQGIVAQLQAEARTLWKAGPQNRWPTWRWRYMSADILRDIDDCIAANDVASTNLLTAALVEQLLEYHAIAHGRWPAKCKRLLAELEQWDASTAQLARQALTQADLATRRGALEDLAQLVLAPLGGLMPLEWQTEWEASQQ
jgi:predicted nucleotidyltransferase